MFKEYYDSLDITYLINLFKTNITEYNYFNNLKYYNQRVVHSL